MWRTASILIGIVLVLVTLGVVMLASTSGVQGETLYKDAHFFVKRQVWALVAGFIAAAIASRFDYRYLRVLAPFIAVVSIVLLVMAITPGVGVSVKGSSRWLRFGPFNLQPSELAKFAAILLLAWWMSRVQRRASEFKMGLLAPLAMLGLIAIFIFLEPDYGTTMLISAVGLAIMFVGGSRIDYLVVTGTTGALAFFLAILEDDERRERFLAFLNPEKYAQGEAYQLLMAEYALVVGGGGGVGLGGSLQKQFYLPEAHTDFIFAIVGEELGYGASIGVVVLYLLFFVCGLAVSLRAPDTFGRLLAFGITAMITLQAAINIGVVTGCLPTKGLPLPFISFGGTSIFITLAMVGVLINIARQGGGDLVIRDKGHEL